jgi:hypothetical protein
VRACRGVQFDKRMHGASLYRNAVVHPTGPPGPKRHQPHAAPKRPLDAVQE